MLFEEVEEADAHEDVAEARDAAGTPEVRHSCELLDATAADNKFLPIIFNIVGTHILAFEVGTEDWNSCISFSSFTGF